MTTAELALLPTASTRSMEYQERMDGIEQMLTDLRMLAEIDGCIAAAWAFEFITELQFSENMIFRKPS